MKRTAMIGAAAAAVIAIILVSLPTTPPPIPSPMELNATGFEVVVSNLEVPWAIDFADDGRIFFTERAGRVRMADSGGNLMTEPVFERDVARAGEAGMLGLALDPDFSENGYIYVYYTHADVAGNLWNRVSRLAESGSGHDEQVLVDGIPGAAIHDGGRIKFGPDGKLYITTGDAADQSLPQDLDSLAGKILRINPDGSIPGDNPFEGSPIYSYGHRNPQGLAWHPVTKQLYATEHGPVGNDEINIIRAGGNYGWPIEQCAGPEEYIDSIACYEVSIAPSGGTFYSSDRLPFGNSFFFGALRGEHVERVVTDDSGSIVKFETFLDGFGRIRDVAVGPDGYIYVATSNRDGRGIPAADDDKILRITRSR